MKTYVARQPIFKRDMTVIGYELLFRDSEKNSFPVGVPGDVSTANVLINSFLNMDFEDVVDGKVALVNFPIESLREELPSLMPSKKIIVEILETVKPNEETFQIIRKLHRQGYILALDDFVFDEKWLPILKYIKLIKFDLRATPLETILHHLPKLKKMKVKLLAEKVETREEYQQCRDFGFDYFQGYFFSKPEIISGNEASVSDYLIMQIYHEALKDDINFNKISKLFEQESTLTYQILKLVNNALEAETDINSVKQALVFLGEKRVRQFVCLLATGKLGKNKPAELVKLAFIRSVFCDQLAVHTRYRKQKEDLFFVGLLSTMDALLDKSMHDIMEELPVNENVKKCLVERKGDYYIFLKLIESIEQADWEMVKRIERATKINPDLIINTYKKALLFEKQNYKYTKQAA